MRPFASALWAAVACALPASATGPGPAPQPPSGAALRSLARPPVYAPMATQRIYFVLTDRYANGDPSNDRGGLSGSRSATGYDPAHPGWFHGGDLRGLTGRCRDRRRGLARVRELGFTAVWVTPPYGQRAVQGNSAAYHGYWPLDLTTVDPHLGSERDFAAFVACAHRLRLKVYLDVVVNHTADVIIPSGGTSWVGPDQAPYRDCRGRPFDPARFAGSTTFPCLKASMMPRPPVVLASQRHAKRPAWLNDLTKYHNRGDIDWSSCSDICLEQGDFFGLDDLFTEQPAVVRGLAAVYATWIRRFRVDGFRVDAARHVDRAFFRVWVPRVMAAARRAGARDFQIFAEAWISSAIDLAALFHDRALPNVLDFPFQEAVTAFASGATTARAVAALLHDDDYFHGPSGTAYTPVTFLGNHDMGRAAFQLRERSGAEGGELLRRDLLAHDLLYLLRGAPAVMYGDEVGMIGRGGDAQARQDMFPTAVAEWRDQERLGAPPIGEASSFDLLHHPIAQRLRTLAGLRESHPVLATGATAVRLARGGTLVLSRVDGEDRREYVLAFNAGERPARVRVATATPSSGWAVLLGATPARSSDRNGRLVLDIPPLSSTVLRADDRLPRRRPVRPLLRVGEDLFTGLQQLTAAVPSAEPVSVAFAARRAGGARWQRLAVDDSPPYRAFVDPKELRSGEGVYAVAVARLADGTVAVSPVVPLPRARS